MSTRARVVLASLVVAAVAAGTAWAWRAHGSWNPQPPRPAAAGTVGVARVDVPEGERAPPGVRIRVQVLNATATRGLARRATQVLRDRGFDVVETGNAVATLDTTLVLDRSGNPEWAARVALAMGGARVEAHPDSSRYLDVTVLIGSTWRAPAEPFYP